MFFWVTVLLMRRSLGVSAMVPGLVAPVYVGLQNSKCRRTEKPKGLEGIDSRWHFWRCTECSVGVCPLRSGL